MEAERFLLKWNNHQSNLVTVFDQLYEQEAFTDVTLACDGRSFAAHKVILSACSPYFQQLFLSNPCKHPIIFMRDVKAGDLDALLAFMYRGEINVHQHDLASFLKTAESLQIKGLSDSSDKPRDTSKILEAMERKFSSNYVNNVSSTNPAPSVTSNSNFSLGIGSIFGSPLYRTSPISSVLPNMAALSRPLSQSISSSSDHSAPPAKKLKCAVSPEDLPKILPKPDEFPKILPKVNATQGLASPVPGLLTPITLAAAVMKSIPANPATPPCPSTPEMNNSPNPDANDSKDGPHPLFLVSNVGGGGGLGTLNSSGNSTPSQEVKIEEEDPLEENNLSDDPNSSGPQDVYDSALVSMRGEVLTHLLKKEPQDVGYTVKINLNPGRVGHQNPIFDSILKSENFNLECKEPEPVDEEQLLSTDLHFKKIQDAGILAAPKPFDCQDSPLSNTREQSLVKSVMIRMDELGEDLQNNPEFLSCLKQEVRNKFSQEDLERKRPVQMSGLKDHTYMVPRKCDKQKQRPNGFQCGHCFREFAANRKHRYISHLRVHTGERPYRCNICDKGFTRQDHLSIHMKVHLSKKM